MTPYYQDDWLTVYHGDCKAVMAAMEPESVHCVVTSPPYWGLRDYGTATWVGGDEACDHALPRRRTYGPDDAKEAVVSPVRPGDPGNLDCARCGAHRTDSQLGLEPTPEEYVANLVAVFREVRRVLRADGTVWLNLGDSYADANRHAEKRDKDASGVVRPVESKTCERCGAPFEAAMGRRFCSAYCGGSDNSPRRARPGALKAKDLVGIPWRVAFALQADGWYLRSDIIWAKPNPMPESVTDRPTKSHEYIFLLSKSPRYYFDADAVREPNDHPNRSGTNPRYDALRTLNGRDRGRQNDEPINSNPAGRNIRSVWTMATQPYPGAHFATFPETLPERCIKAGCPEGGTVLDPFAGSGTTGMVAQSLSRRAVLIDLSLDYLGQLMARNADIPLGLTS